MSFFLITSKENFNLSLFVYFILILCITYFKTHQIERLHIFHIGNVFTDVCLFTGGGEGEEGRGGYPDQVTPLPARSGLWGEAWSVLPRNASGRLSCF